MCSPTMIIILESIASGMVSIAFAIICYVLTEKSRRTKANAARQKANAAREKTPLFKLPIEIR